MTRSCGGCTACCTILPVGELDKPALTRCQHQRSGKGCAIYDRRPQSCVHWSCVWLALPEETRDLSRPDRSGYVIDILPDYVTTVNDDTGERANYPVVQVWVSKSRPDAHRDPALRAYLERLGTMALVRIGGEEAFLLSPPATNTEGAWVEKRSMTREREHTRAEVDAALREAGDRRTRPPQTPEA